MVKLPPRSIPWPRRRDLACALIGLTSLVALPASAGAFSAATANAIESCVDASMPIHFDAGERRASLEPADAAEVATALLSRYPAVAETGVVPDGIVLWAKPGDGWVYVALITNPDKTDDVCFVATFASTKFKFTTKMKRKYFGVDA